jgi:UDP-glucose 4-epimerase
MNVLITGGCGYVGRTLTRLLIKNHAVCIVDNQRYRETRFKKEELKYFDLKKADIRDKKKVAEIISDFQPDVIFHLAAIHYIPECEAMPALAISTNIEGTINLLSQCPEHCRLVFASSGAVYSPQEAPHSEVDSPCGPMDVYGFTKLHAEEYVKYFSQLRGFPAVVVRLFNVVGPGETNPHLLPEIFAQLESGSSLLKLGNLTSKRDYIDLRDAAEGFWAVASRGLVPLGETVTVNLGTMTQYSAQDLLDRVREIGGFSFEVQQDPGRMRKVDRPFLSANIDRIKELFGWEPRCSIDETIREMVKDPDLPQSLIDKYRL